MYNNYLPLYTFIGKKAIKLYKDNDNLITITYQKYEKYFNIYNNQKTHNNEQIWSLLLFLGIYIESFSAVCYTVIRKSLLVIAI